MSGHAPASASSVFADVRDVSQNVANRTVLELAAIARAGADAVEPTRDGEVRFARGKAAEDFDDQGGFGRLENELTADCAIAKRRICLTTAAARLFRHALAHFICEIDGVVFGHGLQHGLEDDGKFVVFDALGGADHLHAAVAAEHGFVTTESSGTGESVKAMHEDGVEGRGLAFGGGDHPHERRALLGTAAGDALIDIDVFGGDDKPVVFRPGADEAQLGSGAVFGLVFGRYADVGGLRSSWMAS